MRKIVLSVAAALLTLAAFGQTKIETLKINWPEEYKWKVETDQDNQSVHMVELIPSNETIDKWTIMGTMMSIKGAKLIRMDNVVSATLSQVKQTAPNAVLTVIERNDDSKNRWILFKVEAPGFTNDPIPESQLYYVIQGASTLYTNFVAIKEKTLSSEFVEKWKLVFKGSELVYQ